MAVRSGRRSFRTLTIECSPVDMVPRDGSDEDSRARRSPVSTSPAFPDPSTVSKTFDVELTSPDDDSRANWLPDVSRDQKPPNIVSDSADKFGTCPFFIHSPSRPDQPLTLAVPRQAEVDTTIPRPSVGTQRSLGEPRTGLKKRLTVLSSVNSACRRVMSRGVVCGHIHCPY